MKAEQNLDRVLNIKWHQDESRSESQTTLLGEYVRRMALWTVKVKLETVGAYWTFYDVGARTTPFIRAPEEMVDRLRLHLNNYEVTLVPFNICEWYVHWGAIEDAELANLYNLPAPYEPIIMMFERGVNRYQIEHGSTIRFNSQTVLLHKSPEFYASIKAFTDLDNHVLDEIDSSSD